MQILANSITAYSYLREHLLAEYEEIDEETLADTLEGLTSLPDVLAAVVRRYLDDLTMAAALGMRITEMQARLARIEARGDKKRALITSVMERAQLRQLKQPDFTASLRAIQPRLVVGEEAAIPAVYWLPQPAKLDRRALLGALASGQAVPGASLDNGGITLSVRTK